jgi:hypothetical protein
VDLRAGLDTVVSKRKIISPHRESNSDHPIVQPVASGYTDWDISASDIIIIDQLLLRDVTLLFATFLI